MSRVVSHVEGGAFYDRVASQPEDELEIRLGFDIVGLPTAERLALADKLHAAFGEYMTEYRQRRANGTVLTYNPSDWYKLEARP